MNGPNVNSSEPPAIPCFEVVRDVYVGPANLQAWKGILERVDVFISLRRSPDRLVADERRYHLIPMPYWEMATPHHRLREILSVVLEARSQGETVGVHCWAGLDRSGLVALAVLMDDGASFDEAISDYVVRRGQPLPRGSFREILERAFVGNR